MSFKDFITNLPEVKPPLQKRLPFKEKLKWTLMVLVAFFVLGMIPLYGMSKNALAEFEYLSLILGAKFGSIISLGIGPLVTASIVLQLLTGSGILKFDLTTAEGKKYFQGVQKLLGFFFIVFEAGIYVFMGGLSPDPLLGPQKYFLMQLFLVAQLVIGGIVILYMDEVAGKWGFISGISLFIAAGVSKEIMVRAFSPLTTAGTFAFGTGQAPVGKVWALFTSLMQGNPKAAFLAFWAIFATILVFLLSVYGQAMQVEIPLSFGRVRGYGIRWPLKFIYTSNIPVILIAALMANLQLWARLMQNWGFPLLGTFQGRIPVSGFVAWIYPPRIFEKLITGAFAFSDILHALSYAAFLIGGSVIFSIFWVQTAGMDAKSQAKQIIASGLQIPGFRRDVRVLEAILNRYIYPLTVMGAILVGILAASADLMGALTHGTGILLAVMIIYRFYEVLVQQHAMDMHPMLRKMIE